MSKSKDSLSIIIAYVAFGCLAVGFGFAWLYQNTNEKPQAKIAYVTVGPLLVNAQDYAFSVSLSVQTSAADAEWAAKNKEVLTAVLQQALINTKAQSLRNPGGLLLLQQSLKKAGNAAMGKNNLQEIFLTDFVFESN